jgi:hypothetical protein
MAIITEEQRSLALRSARDLTHTWQALDSARDHLVHIPVIYGDNGEALGLTVEAMGRVEFQLRWLLAEMEPGTRGYVLSDMVAIRLRERLA